MSGTARALKCYVELDICSVACQQVRLCHGGDIYLRISFLGQVVTTRAVRPVFPLKFNQKFHFAKVFRAAYEPSQVSKALQCSHVSLRLMQTLPAIGSDILLASFESDAGTILYPVRQHSKTTSQQYYETSSNLQHLLLYRTEYFPGVNPQLMYKVRIVICDTAQQYSSDCDAAFGTGKTCQCNKCWPFRGNPAWNETVGLVRKSSHKARRSPSDERGGHRRAQNSVRRFKQHDLPFSNQLQRNRRKRLSRSVPSQTRIQHYHHQQQQPIAPPVKFTSSSVGQQKSSTRRRQSRSVPVRCRRSSSSVSPVLRPANGLLESSGSQCHCVRRPGSAARHAKFRQKNVEPNRPPFVVRRIDSKLFRRTPGLGYGSQSRARSENRRLAVKQTKLIEHARNEYCDSIGISDVESVSSSVSDGVRCQDIEETADDSDTLADNDTELSDSYCESSTRSNCRVCEAYERYMGRPYCGHSRGHHHVTNARQTQAANQTRLSADERIELQPAHYRYITHQPRSVKNTNYLDKTNSGQRISGFQHSASDWLDYDARHQDGTDHAGLLNSKLSARRAGTVEANLVNRQQAESERAKHQHRNVMTSHVSGNLDREPVDRQYTADVSAADWREYREDSFLDMNRVSRLRDSYWSKDVSKRPGSAVDQSTIPSVVNSETVRSDSNNTAIRQDIRRSLSNFYLGNSAPRPLEATHSVDKQRVLHMY